MSTNIHTPQPPCPERPIPPRNHRGLLQPKGGRRVSAAALTAALLVAGCTAEGDDGAPSSSTPVTSDARPASTTTDAVPTTTDENPPPTAPDAERGSVIEITPLATMQVEELQQLIDQVAIPGFTEAHYGLDVRQIVYETIDPDGKPTHASGTIILPIGADGPLPVLSDQHGTQTADVPADAPLIARELFGAGLFFASQGYVVIGADYLGFGASEGIHPYYHAASAASATLDMLRAAHHAAPELDVDLSDQLYLTGYSQGAHVTMALHRAIEESGEFEVTASAPMAGAYDLAAVSVPTSLTNPAPSSSMYLAYAVLGLGMTDGSITDLAEVFRAPYHETIVELFDGSRQPDAIAAALPADPRDLFLPQFIDDLVAGRGAFAESLRSNGVYDWAPIAPVRLIHGRADADVPFRNAEVAAERMRQLGADVEIIDLGDLDHVTASTPSYLAAADWFDTMR